MAVKINPTSMRYISLPELADQTRGVQNAHLLHEQGILDLNQALASVKSQVDALSPTTATGTGTTSTTVISENVVASGFPGLGLVNDQTGNVAYTVQQSDSGALIVVDDAAPVTVTLNSAVTKPYFFFITNFGVGTATLAPTSGLVNGLASLPFDNTSMVVFDGVNWTATEMPVSAQNAPAILHQFITAYNAITGAFSQAQPAFTDIAGTPSTVQVPFQSLTTTGSGAATLAAGVLNVPTPATPTGFSGTITTAKLTSGGTNGSMTFVNGTLSSQVAAT